MASMRKKMNNSEVEILFSCVEKHKKIVMCKKTDAITNKLKKDAWQKITDDYNSRNINKKSDTQLHNTFRNKLGEFRKVLAEEKAERFKTGGGPYKTKLSELNPIYSFVEASIRPLPNIDSSDALFQEDYSPEYLDVQIPEEEFTEGSGENYNTHIDVFEVTVPSSVSEPTTRIEPQDSEVTVPSSVSEPTTRIEPQPSTSSNARSDVIRSRASKISKSENLKNSMMEQIVKTEKLKQKYLKVKIKYYKTKMHNEI